MPRAKPVSDISHSERVPSVVCVTFRFEDKHWERLSKNITHQRRRLRDDLENAASEYLRDRIAFLLVPTPGQMKVFLQEANKASVAFEKVLRQMDSASLQILNMKLRRSIKDTSKFHASMQKQVALFRKTISEMSREKLPNVKVTERPELVLSENIASILKTHGIRVTEYVGGPWATFFKEILRISRAKISNVRHLYPHFHKIGR